jgi:ribonuclease-3
VNDQELSELIGYRFKKPSLLLTSLTHSSYINESGQDIVNNNERLEFLGDAIFDAIISEYLYDKMKDVEEGRLTKLRALIVCERSLAECGNRLGINRHLRLGKGEEQNGGRYRNSIIADAMEALIAAIYLDGGLKAAKDFVLNSFKDTIDRAMSGEIHSDFKTELQEKLQAKGKPNILYQVDRQEGPDHRKTFYISLWADGEKIGQGQGKSKKEAEQNAAKSALEGNGIVF